MSGRSRKREKRRKDIAARVASGTFENARLAAFETGYWRGVPMTKLRLYTILLNRPEAS